MTDEQKKALFASIVNNINAPALLSDILKQILDPALEKIVQDSSNPFDNMLKAAIYPALEAELLKLAKEQWEKLLAV